MKKKIFLALAVMLVAVMVFAGCSSDSEQGSTTSDDQQLANPWTESDEQGVADATGFDMVAPEGATEVAYSYMSEGSMAQMTYELDGAKWVYRIQSGERMADISGMEYGWTDVTDGGVVGCAATYYSNGDGSDIVRVIDWFDSLTCVNYSLSATGKDFSSEEMFAYAQSVYVDLQGDASGDDDTAEALSYFIGEHKRSEDESTLTIAENDDGTFDVNLSITRLCSLEDGIGTYEDQKITFTVKDPDGNDMTGVIYRDSDNNLTVQITDSTWSLLPTDEVFEGFENTAK